MLPTSLPQTETMKARWTRLMPNDLPRWVRCYDDGRSGDRYTVVFTGNYAGRKGCDYLGMSGAPFHPQGVGNHGWKEDTIDRPAYGHLGRKIRFIDLPEDCQVLVLRDYLTMWGFVEHSGQADKLARELVGARFKAARKRLEQLRRVLRAENISYGELHELQCMVPYIAPGDYELLEPAGVPEADLQKLGKA